MDVNHTGAKYFVTYAFSNPLLPAVSLSGGSVMWFSYHQKIANGKSHK